MPVGPPWSPFSNVNWEPIWWDNQLPVTLQGGLNPLAKPLTNTLTIASTPTYLISELHRRLCEGVGELTTPQPRRTPNPQTRTDGPGVVTLNPPTVTPPRKITPRPEGICLMVPNICRNGLCVSLGGVMEYRCECFEGYENAGRYTCQGRQNSFIK